MKLAVVGSRTYLNKHTVFCILLEYYRHYGDDLTIVSGGCPRGPDNYAELFAEKYNIPTEIYPADWNAHGRAAGFIRNSDIVNACDEVVAFWDRKSKGTKDTITKAKKSNKEVIIVDTDLTFTNELVKLLL